MENYDLNDIQEIIVTLNDGKKFKFIDKGLNRFFRLVTSQVEFEDENSSIKDQSPKKSSPNQKSKASPATVGGYTAFHLDYSPQNNGGRSPMDIAKELQKQAHGKINFL